MTLPAGQQIPDTLYNLPATAISLLFHQSIGLLELQSDPHRPYELLVVDLQMGHHICLDALADG